MHEPSTAAIWAMPIARHRRLVVEDPPEVVAVGEHLVLLGQERAAGVDEVDARQPVLARDLLGAQVLLDRDRVVRAALDGGVVGDDHARPAGDPADAGDDPGARRIAAVHPLGGERPTARGTATPDRGAHRPGRGAAACRARRDVGATPPGRRAPPRPCGRGDRRRARPSPPGCAARRPTPDRSTNATSASHPPRRGSYAGQLGSSSGTGSGAAADSVTSTSDRSRSHADAGPRRTPPSTQRTTT